MGYDDRNGIAATGHLQWLSAVCSEQLSKQGTVIVTTETLEESHDFIHQDDDATLIVVMDSHHGLLRKVREDGLNENWFVRIIGVAIPDSSIMLCIALVFFDVPADLKEVMFLKWTIRIVKWRGLALSWSSY